MGTSDFVVMFGFNVFVVGSTRYRHCSNDGSTSMRSSIIVWQMRDTFCIFSGATTFISDIHFRSPTVNGSDLRHRRRSEANRDIVTRSSADSVLMLLSIVSSESNGDLGLCEADRAALVLDHLPRTINAIDVILCDDH